MTSIDDAFAEAQEQGLKVKKALLAAAGRANHDALMRLAKAQEAALAVFSAPPMDPPPPPPVTVRSGIAEFELLMGINEKLAEILSVLKEMKGEQK